MTEPDGRPALVVRLEDVHGLSPVALTALLGGKAANLVVMATQLGLPVPPAFTLTTAACRAFLADGRWPNGLEEQLPEQMGHLEAVLGRRFGDPRTPLLVSVRSGAPTSMPGMMDTILNVGLTEAATRGLAEASGDAAFAADCRRRLEAMYRDVVGIDAVPDDPWLQLHQAVEAVFRSWNNERAIAYRRHEDIADDAGTAATIQAMVFGNLGPDSGTGVVFTRNPATGAPGLYGDVLVNAQGEDVVAGTHRTQPVEFLDDWLPEAAQELRRHAAALEQHFADLCDIEFTIERGKLWLLQVRVGKRSPEAALRIALEMAEAADFPLTRADAVRRVAALLADPPHRTARVGSQPPIAVGLGASPGVATGEIATTPDAVIEAADAGRPAILVRSETSPDDVHGMERAAGVLTSTGGFVSHAAVVARGWGIPAVVGAAAVVVGPDGVTIGGHEYRAGETLTIDGASGDVYAGAIEIRRSVVPEAERMLTWAGELGIEVGHPARGRADAPVGGRADGPARLPMSVMPEARPVTADVIVRTLGIRGPSTLEGLSDALGAMPEEVGGLLAALASTGLAEHVAGTHRLTIEGKAHCRVLIAADAELLGPDRTAHALDVFAAFDRRLKDAVTAWQVREIDGAQAFNDHTDPNYDGEILGRLQDLHAAAIGWLAGLAQRCSALARYRDRLDRALAAALAGDVRFVASPRVDSYHGVWFELHEELIRLAGRRRAEEVAAGRA